MHGMIISELDRQAAEHKARRARMAAAAIKREHSAITLASHDKKITAKLAAIALAHREAEEARKAAEYVKAIRAKFKYVPTPQTALNPLAGIMRQGAEKYGFTVEQIKSASRHHPLVLARQEFFYRAKVEAKKSFPDMARFCGGRDHSTSIWGYRQHARRIANEEA